MYFLYLEGVGELAQNISEKDNIPLDNAKNDEDVIADLCEPGQSDAAADVSKPQTPDDNGGEPINAKTQTSSSEGKGRENISNNQENLGKTSSLVQLRKYQEKSSKSEWNRHIVRRSPLPNTRA